MQDDTLTALSQKLPSHLQPLFEAVQPWIAKEVFKSGKSSGSLTDSVIDQTVKAKLRTLGDGGLMTGYSPCAAICSGNSNHNSSDSCSASLNMYFVLVMQSGLRHQRCSA